MSTFQVILTLKENDDSGHRVGDVIDSICRRDGLGGGGGYQHGRHNGGDPVVLIFQRNDDDGNLCDVTGDDLTYAGRVLAEHPNVTRFLVGPIESCGRTIAAMDADEDRLIRAFQFGVS